MDTADRENGVTCDMPIQILWGAKSHTGRLYDDVLSTWREWCPNAVGGPIACGHYVQEEAPDAVFDWFMKFFPD
jgi:haloacetate dehalogenase